MAYIPTFGQIMTEELVFYDENFLEKCSNFCERRNVDYLPGVDGESVFEFSEDGFKERCLEKNKDQLVRPTKRIFSPGIVEKFDEFKVLFIYEDREIVGVVHFSDYNRKPVYLYLYDRIYELETSIRKLLYLEKVGAGGNSSGPFQNYGLPALIDRLHDTDIELQLPKEDLRELRNRVMHERQFVEHEDFQEKSLHYSLESFRKSFQRVSQLHKSIREVNNQVKLREELEDHPADYEHIF